MTVLKGAFLIIISIFFLSGCNTLGVGVQGSGSDQKGPHQNGENQKQYKKGPPPHAPAHGYRHKHHDGNSLEYDNKIGAYVVLNFPETYFRNNLYIRLSTDGKWLVSITLEGGWRLAVGGEVPYRLIESKYQKNQKNKKPKKEKWN